MSSTYSAGLAASASGLSAPGCAPSPSASQNHSVAQSSPSTGQPFPATTTCAHSPQTDWLLMESAPMSSAEDSPAKTSAMPGKAPGSQANDLGFGMNSTGSLKKSGRGTRLSKTSQPFALEDWTLYSGASLRSGMTRSGTVYPLRPLALLTAGIDGGGSYIPTPTAGDARSAGSRNLPGSKAKAGVSLTDFVKYGNSTTPRKMWPTPDASPHKYRLQGNSQQSKSLNAIHGGKLNPTWVEWLMGFPLGHTDLKPSEMPSSRKYRKSSGTQ